MHQLSNLLTSYVYFGIVLLILVKCVNSFVLEQPILESHESINVENLENVVKNNTINVPMIDILPKFNEIFELITEMDNENETDSDNGGRGSSGFGKKKKYRKFLYPVIIGLFITKMIMFPMFVKAVTILSSAAFVFSKMSLLASLILGLKFFLTNQNQNDSKVEIVHVPLKKYGGDWDRETAESKFHPISETIYEHDFRPTQFIY